VGIGGPNLNRPSRQREPYDAKTDEIRQNVRRGMPMFRSDPSEGPTREAQHMLGIEGDPHQMGNTLGFTGQDFLRAKKRKKWKNKRRGQSKNIARLGERGQWNRT